MTDPMNDLSIYPADEITRACALILQYCSSSEMEKILKDSDVEVATRALLAVSNNAKDRANSEQDITAAVIKQYRQDSYIRAMGEAGEYISKLDQYFNLGRPVRQELLDEIADVRITTATILRLLQVTPGMLLEAESRKLIKLREQLSKDQEV